ncbi:MAG TPA: DUF853 family protein [Flavipsychrobacter sp.]|nr:DUF853 family protein [Flavipsychrobacter sp.]
MNTTENFLETIKKGYSFKGECAKIGAASYNGMVLKEAEIFLPLQTLNRHGLIAGATGTGKTKTLQVISEVLSDASVPVLLMDVKGDLSGIAVAGDLNEKISERSEQIGIPFEASGYPTELLTLSTEKGVHLRATVTEFGPVLLSKILSLNDTQSGLVSVLFKYCDDNRLPLLDLKDFIKILQFAGAEGKVELEKSYGKISTQSTGTILRKVIELQQQGADDFFGERSFEVEDLMRISNDGRGMINILRITDMQDRPKMFSTFMLQLLSELYAVCPEEGDMEKPKLVLFIDEAHLIFQEASDVLLQQIETVIKLIRSKGIGIFFVTQNPMDIPASVLGQLGLKVQHALRAFTALDRKAIKQASENYPETEFYRTEEIITQLGIGEALITALNEKGTPTPLAHVMLRPPKSRMGLLLENEIDTIVSKSRLVAKYNTAVDTKSAYEILNEKIEAAAQQQEERVEETAAAKKTEKEESIFDHPIVRSVGRTAATMITRSLLGSLGFGGRSRKKSWF